MKQNIVAVSGTHGTGKTTLVYSLAEKFKRQRIADGDVGLILETARLCPLPVMSVSCRIPSEEAQFWIFAKQIQEEMEFSSRYRAVISDRTLVDCYAYTRYCGYYGLAHDMWPIVKASVKRYHTIYFRQISDCSFSIDDNFRNMERVAREEIEGVMLKIYHQLGVVLMPCPMMVQESQFIDL
jgi:predicted ATPase